MASDTFQAEKEQLQLEILRRRLERGINALRRDIRKDVMQTELDNAEFFLFRGARHICVADKFQREYTLSDDGNPQVIDLSLRVRFQNFSTTLGHDPASSDYPRSGEIIRYPINFDLTDTPDSEDFRVRRIRSKASVILWIDCVSTEV